MRNDPLQMAEKPVFMCGTLPGELRTPSVSIDIALLERLAEIVARILENEPGEDFNRKLGELKPVPVPVGLQERIDILGLYDSGQKRITVDVAKISRCAEDMRACGQNVSDADLVRVVEIHEEQHALHHLAQDGQNNSSIWHEFSCTPSYLLESLAQLFTYNVCQSNTALEYAFVQLEKLQPCEYRLWRLFKHVSEEKLYWIIRDRRYLIEPIITKIGFGLPLKMISGWDLRRIANKIQNDTEGNIHGRHIPKVVHESYPYPANCYPGEPANQCFETAFFFSLTARRYVNSDKGHLSFRQMLGCFARHMEGKCGGITKQVCILSDNWDADAYDELKPFIDEIKRTVKVSACLIVGKSYSWFGV